MTIQIKAWYMDLIVNDQPVLPSPQHLNHLLKFRNDYPEINDQEWSNFVAVRHDLILALQDPYSFSEVDGEYTIEFDTENAPSPLVIELINVWAKALTWKSVKFVTVNTYSHYSGYNVKHGLKIDVTFSTKDV